MAASRMGGSRCSARDFSGKLIVEIVVRVQVVAVVTLEHRADKSGRAV